jgi:hypothetical protein
MVEAAVTEAIDRLYAAFAGEPRPADLQHCPCCVSDEQVDELLRSSNVRTMPADAVADYATHALTTVGTVADFRYFLPRVLQVAVTDEAEWLDLELVCGRLRSAGWTAWADDEQQAVRHLLKMLWEQTLHEYPSRLALDTVLCAIGNAEDDLTEYLTAWGAALTKGDVAPAQQLSDLVSWSARVVHGRWRLRNAFWDNRDGQVAAWLAAESTRAAVVAGFDAATSEPALAALADLAALL